MSSASPGSAGDPTGKSLYFDYRHHDFVAPAEMRGETPAHPVAICGAGPVGLVLALDLARRGVPVVVLEDDDTVSHGSRAVGMARRTLETLDRLGTCDPFMAKGISWSGGKSYYQGELVLDFKIVHDPRVKHPPMISIAQCQVEQYLLDELERCPHVDIRWGSRLMEVRQQDHGVSMLVATKAGEYEMKAEWLVGCDGARSVVRKSIGLEFTGSSHEGRYLIADIKMHSSEPPQRRVWFDPEGFPGSTIIMHKQPDDIWRIDYQLGPEDSLEEEVTPERVADRVGRFLQSIGETAPWELDWISPYRAHSLMVESFRQGRIILAGDAAHLVPIFGARGMNGGIEDSNNLAWKLAYVVQQRSDPSLLDSYSSERVDATRQNLVHSEKSTLFMTPPTHGHTLMRDAVLSLAITQPFVRPLLDPRQMAETPFPRSPLNLPADTADRFERGPAPGYMCPNLPFGTGTPSYLHKSLGRDFTVLIFRGPGSQPLPDSARAALAGLLVPAALCEIHAEGDQAHSNEEPAPGHTIIRQGTAALFEAFDAREGTVYLVRPDTIVAGRWRRRSLEQLARDIEATAHVRQGASHG